MSIDRQKSPTRHTGMLAGKLSALNCPCIGCSDCQGFCPALFDALILPELILSRRTREA